MVITTLLYSADNRVCVIVDEDQTVFAMLVGEVGVVEEEEVEEGHHLRDKETYIDIVSHLATLVCSYLCVLCPSLALTIVSIEPNPSSSNIPQLLPVVKDAIF